jgi:CHAT domain-containing protein/Flp pilus assembly protein TadD
MVVQTKRILVCVSLPLAMAGTFALLRHANEVFPATPKIQPKSPHSSIVSAHGFQLFQAGRFLEAMKIYEAEYRKAQDEHDAARAVRALNNLAGCSFALFRYREAADMYLKARELARAGEDWDAVCTSSLNLSSLYLQMGETNSAEQAVLRSAEALAKVPGEKWRPQLLLQYAKVKARQGNIDAAKPYFVAAIEEADRREDTKSLIPQAWNLLGYELLEAGRTEDAEGPLVEAFRLRKFARDPDIGHSYRTLGMLRLKQRDLRSASALLDEAVALAKARPGKMTGWSAYCIRGETRMAEGNEAAALEDFRSGIELARRWRVEVLPADAMRVGMEVELDRLYSGLIRAAVGLYRKTGRRELAGEAFEAAEENRAVSLRALVGGRDGWQSLLPPEYGEMVRQLRAVEAQAAIHPSPAADVTAGRLEHALTEMELKAGLDFGCGSGASESSRGLLKAVQRRLRPGQALLSFYLEDQQSYLWVITRGGLELHLLPGRKRIAVQVDAFARAVRENSQDATALGAQIFAEFFGMHDGAARSSREWVLSLDDTLFRMPFAALVEGFDRGRAVYAVERHSLQVTPSAHLLAAAPAGARAGGRFIGVGDPVYNSADPRAPGRVRPAKFELPRLAGAGREIEVCAREWMPAGRAELLSGRNATREALKKALAGPPAILHLATHVVTSEQGQVMVALAMRPEGGPELLSSSEIARWRANLALVVLSGCGSGKGPALPGAGLMGMTRAWLAAGAASVAASYWPTPDDNGDFFVSFYRLLRENAGRRPARALQQAQLEALRSGGRTSTPGLWAAYFLVGKE